MISFVKKLLLGRQLEFEQGRLSLFDQRILIVPVELILLLIQKSGVDKKFEQSIYQVMKESVYRFCETLAKRRGVKRDEMVKILINLAEMNGYGKLELRRINFKSKVAVFQMRHLPSELVQQSLQNKKKVVDTYWAGMLAGGAAWIFGDRNIECKETRCVITGKESCEFVIQRP